MRWFARCQLAALASTLAACASPPPKPKPPPEPLPSPSPSTLVPPATDEAPAQATPAAQAEPAPAEDECSRWSHDEPEEFSTLREVCARAKRCGGDVCMSTKPLGKPSAWGDGLVVIRVIAASSRYDRVALIKDGTWKLTRCRLTEVGDMYLMPLFADEPREGAIVPTGGGAVGVVRWVRNNQSEMEVVTLSMSRQGYPHEGYEVQGSYEDHLTRINLDDLSCDDAIVATKPYGKRKTMSFQDVPLPPQQWRSNLHIRANPRGEILLR